MAFFAYTEGYKAFHLKFSPMVVKRSLTLRDAPLAHKLAGPLYAMGLFHATRKRVDTSWGFLVGVFGLVKLVQRLPYPWRSVVDAGVVAGLGVGAGSSVDGVHWPLNPAFERAEREAASPEAAQDVHACGPTTKRDRDV